MQTLQYESTEFNTPQKIYEWLNTAAIMYRHRTLAETYLDARTKAIYGKLNPPAPTGNAEEDMLRLRQWCNAEMEKEIQAYKDRKIIEAAREQQKKLKERESASALTQKSIEVLNAGSMKRIADALEAIAAPFDLMKRELNAASERVNEYKNYYIDIHDSLLLANKKLKNLRAKNKKSKPKKENEA